MSRILTADEQTFLNKIEQRKQKHAEAVKDIGQLMEIKSKIIKKNTLNTN